MRIKKILHVVGARPNFVKIAPLMAAFNKYKNIKQILVHTGQHYDRAMSKIFFKELDIPKPDANLGVGGSTTPLEQLGAIMEKLEAVCRKEKPDVMVVVGDVTSTLAGALIANKLGITLAHIESGLRSFDRAMPEEINRVAVDQLADILFATSEAAVKNLKKEKVRGKIVLAGNIMIDTLKTALAKQNDVLEKLKLEPKKYCVATLHRQSNVDSKEQLEKLLDILDALSKKVIWPIHPRTQKNISIFGLENRLKNYRIIAPLGYLEFINLVKNAAFAITDSGGIQEETTYMGVPCITLRTTTEWTETVTHGTNRLAQTKAGVLKILANLKTKKMRLPKYWDGATAARIAKMLAR